MGSCRVHLSGVHCSLQVSSLATLLSWADFFLPHLQTGSLETDYQNYYGHIQNMCLLISWCVGSLWYQISGLIFFFSSFQFSCSSKCNAYDKTKYIRILHILQVQYIYCRCNIYEYKYIQWNNTISNLVHLNSLLFWGKVNSLEFTISCIKLGYFKLPATSNWSLFP